MQVSAKTTQKPDPVTVEYDVPESLAGLSEAFGEDVIASASRGAIVISLQAFMRRLIEKEKTQEEIQAEVDTWKPDTRSVVKQSAFEKATSSIQKLSAEERSALLARLQAMN